MASKEELKQILRELRSGGDSERQPQGGALPRRSRSRARIVRPVVDLGAVTEIAHLLDFMKGERL